MIKINNVYKKFGELEVLENVTIDIKKGEIVSVIGPSGSGKSTLLRCINKLEDINLGNICVDGKKIDKSISKKVGMVFQGFNLFPHKTVLENVIEAPIIVKKLKRKKAIAIADKLLKKVGLTDKKDVYPSKLSGGQKQRVAIARALAMEPEVLLFDEPTSALDPELIGEVLNVIKELANEDITMVIVTHQMQFAKEISDRIVFMDEGKIIEKGDPKKLFNNPNEKRLRRFLKRVI
ncbi:MAG: amino acid ABC transporter ATP-binding protein [Firmicutes bacterium]|nr:amino acid ABC transporter ATP-binding protein [Bacillota bacterium]